MNGNASCGRTRIDFFAQTGAATCAPGKSMICCTGTLNASSANIVPTNLASHKVVRMGDNGRTMGMQARVGATILRIISDAAPDSVSPSIQYAQNRPRGGFASVIINGQQVEPTPGQQARLAVVEAQARDAIQHVRELDPKWQSTPSAYESVEGLIGAYRSDAQQALERISKLQQVGIGPGPFAGGSIPARGPERDFIAAERSAINRIGSETGCHTCGTMSPGTPLENFVLDHQPPTAWNPLGRSQRLYPQCFSCSARQGNWISRNGGRR